MAGSAPLEKFLPTPLIVRYRLIMKVVCEQIVLIAFLLELHVNEKNNISAYHNHAIIACGWYLTLPEELARCAICDLLWRRMQTPRVAPGHTCRHLGLCSGKWSCQTALEIHSKRNTYMHVSALTIDTTDRSSELIRSDRQHNLGKLLSFVNAFLPSARPVDVD